MRYASIRSMDISNGEGIGVALFVQGCHFHCKNCFNHDTWDFNGGKEWKLETKEEFLKLIDKQYITRVSILGGEPLSEENIYEINNLLKDIRYLFRDTKTIWLYTGYRWEQIFKPIYCGSKDWIKCEKIINETRKEIVSNCNILVDGRYEDDLRNITLKFRGSSNQRLIDIQKSIKNNSVITYEL